MILTSSKFSSNNSFNLKRHLALATGVVLLQSEKASLAASTAVSISSLVEIGTLAIVLPVAGFTTSRMSPLDSTHYPPMKFLIVFISFIGSSRSAIPNVLRPNLSHESSFTRAIMNHSLSEATIMLYS